MGMWNTVVRYLIGDIPQKKKYRQQANVLASRRKALPKEYGFVLGEICRCLTACGLDLRSDLERYSELLTLMEGGAAAGCSVRVRRRRPGSPPRRTEPENRGDLERGAVPCLKRSEP